MTFRKTEVSRSVSLYVCVSVSCCPVVGRDLNAYNALRSELLGGTANPYGIDAVTFYCFLRRCRARECEREGERESHPLCLTHLDQLFAYLPTEYAGILLAQLIDASFNLRRGDLRLRAANDARPYRARLLVAIQYFRYTTVRDAQLSRYHTRPHSTGGHFHNLKAYVIGQRTSIDEDAAQLVDASLSCFEKGETKEMLVN